MSLIIAQNPVQSLETDHGLYPPPVVKRTFGAKRVSLERIVHKQLFVISRRDSGSSFNMSAPA